MLKGLVMALVGLLLGTIGIDLMMGEPRYTFGWPELFDRLDFLPVAVGLFAIGELLVNIYAPVRTEPIKASLSGLMPTRQDWADCWGSIMRGTAIGFFVGMLPGAGATISSFLAYATERRVSRHPEKFGTGAIEGVAAPESANNAASTGALVPLMALGIPGSGTTAVMLGALTLYGLQPGPLLMSTNPDVFWGLVASMYVGNVMLLILNLPLAPAFASVLRVPYATLVPVIIGIALFGVYSVENSVFNVGVAVLFGGIGFFMRIYGYPPAPLVLALVLGPMLEKALRQSMQMSLGSLDIFVTRPVSAGILLFAFVAMVYPLVLTMWARYRHRAPAQQAV
jgi:putative tricarboxylic transport membrane protein